MQGQGGSHLIRPAIIQSYMAGLGPPSWAVLHNGPQCFTFNLPAFRSSCAVGVRGLACAQAAKGKIENKALINVFSGAIRSQGQLGE